MYFAYSRIFSFQIRTSLPRITTFRLGIRAVFNMTDDSKPFVVEYASQGRAKCKTCKQQIEKKSARIGKLVTNPFSEDGGLMKQWYHVKCIFEALSRARATTRKIESTNDLDGFQDMDDADKNMIEGFIKDGKTKASSASKSPANKKKVQATLGFSPTKGTAVRTLTTAAGGSSRSGDAAEPSTSKHTGSLSKDDTFREFRRLCALLAGEPSYNAKTKIIADFINTGASGDEYNGDLFLLAKLLLPGVNKRVYNLQSKQLIKLFSQILGSDQDEMLTDLEKGDVAETISDFFEQSHACKPVKKSTLTNQEVDEFLDTLTTFSKEDDQMRELQKMTRKCTVNDLKYIIRLIKHDLRMNTGAKHVLEAIDPDAYKAFQASNNLNDVIKRCLDKRSGDGGHGVPSMKKKLSIRASVMTPIKPMLAEACKSFSQAIKKSPGGMYAEIKYDGERVQVHKSGHKFEFFSRNLKPVTPHKVAAITDFLPKACPHGNNLILDSEVLLVDNKTGTPLPFGTLGIHKKSAFKDASVCLFIFDCIQFNDENVMTKTMQERRQILEKNVTPIKNRIMLSETTFVKTEKELSKLMARAMREGLEGLVLKDLKGLYEPGKRHWLKMKKDYLEEGAMADTADLVVLGAYYGTGNKGGLMSIFLMGVYNPRTKMWCTVAKCGNGHDDKTIERLNRELKMKKISKDPNRVPTWLDIHRSIIPDFVVDDPKKAPVWEITGAEFSKSTKHTANGISIRFPRVTRIRDDKDWETATDLDHLATLFKNSRGFTDTSKMMEDADNEDSEEETTSTSKDVDMDDEGDDTKSPGKRKRKTDLNNDEVEKKKQVCKYGSKCYQTNPEHQRKYFHSLGKASESDDQIKNPSKDLPSVFSGLQIFVSDDMKDAKKLKRYIIAYDGDIVSELNKDTATHIVCDKKDASGRGAVAVTANWVWACIKSKQLVPAKKYHL